MLALVQKTVSLNNHSLFKIMSKIASFFFKCAARKKQCFSYIYEKQVPGDLFPRGPVPAPLRN